MLISFLRLLWSLGCLALLTSKDRQTTYHHASRTLPIATSFCSKLKAPMLYNIKKDISSQTSYCKSEISPYTDKVHQLTAIQGSLLLSIAIRSLIAGKACCLNLFDMSSKRFVPPSRHLTCFSHFRQLIFALFLN